MSDQATVAMTYAASIEKRLRALKQAGRPPAGLPAAVPEGVSGSVAAGAALEAPPGEGEGRGRGENPAAVARPVDSTSSEATAIPDAPRGGDAAAPSPERVQALLRDAEELAAVSGRVNPRVLLPAETDEATRQTVLSRLVPACTVEPQQGQAWWLLLKGPREAVLSRLIREGRLQHVLQQPLPPTDQLGAMLRELLERGAEMPLDGRSEEDLRALASAMEATAGLNLPRPDEAALRARLRSGRWLADYDVLLANGFVGRQHELQEIERFVAQGDQSPSSGWRPWSGLIVCGPGGAGKSTLLAKLVTETAKRQAATVVMLDFDRPGMSAADPYWLEGEIARQVGDQYPELGERLRHDRLEARQHKEELAQQLGPSAAEKVSQERSLRRVLWDVGAALATVQAGARPFVLLLDSFEDVTQRDLEGRLLDWVSEIASALQPIPLRVIFSGRLYEEDRASLASFAGMTVEVGELAPDEAERYLRTLGLPDPLAARLARSDVLPRRPLELKLLAKLAERDTGAAIAELEDEIREGGPAAGELFAGLVYQRVLLRLGSDTARSLAYPGLVLRYVTADLIREVLVPALDLPPLDEAQAQRALDELATYSWLAHREPNGEVWHRRDLRRSILKAILAREPERARLISEQAAAFFENAPRDQERIEGVYHRLMLLREPTGSPTFELAVLKRASEAIGTDVADLPRPASALLKFAVGDDVSLSEVALLPEPYRSEAYDTTGQRLVSSREFGKALQLYRLLRGDSRGPAVRGPRRAWETEALFATASWTALATLGEQPREQPQTPPVDSMERLAALVFPAALITPDLVSASELEQQLIRFAEVASTAPAGADVATRSGTWRETDLQRLAMGIILVNRRAPLSPVARQAVGSIVRQARQENGLTPSPALDRRLWLLDLVGPDSDSGRAEARISPATLKLSPTWLTTLASLVGVLGSPGTASLSIPVAAVAQLLARTAASQDSSARQLLAAVDGLAREPDWRRGVPLVLDADKQRPEDRLLMLRGPDPEFRDPCRFALLEAFPDAASHEALGEIVSSCMELKVGDAAPGSFAAALSGDPEHALEPYVEQVDRTWALGDLLRNAHRQRPTATLGAVLAAYERWDDAVRTTILTAPVAAVATVSGEEPWLQPT